MPNTDPDQLFDHGVEQYESQEYDTALTTFQSALEGYREQQNQFAIGRTLNAIGLTQLQNGEDAAGSFEKALAIFESAKNSNWAAMVLGNLGVFYNQRKQYDKALELYDEALKRITDSSDQILSKKEQAKIFNNKGTVFFQKGKEAEDPQKARKNFEESFREYLEALKIFRQIAESESVEFVTNQIIYLFKCAYLGEEDDFPTASGPIISNPR